MTNFSSFNFLFLAEMGFRTHVILSVNIFQNTLCYLPPQCDCIGDILYLYIHVQTPNVQTDPLKRVRK